MIPDILFYCLVSTSVLGALAIILFRNLLYNALGLLLCLVSVAGIYGLFNAEFLAATQLLIYAGGVLVLILFGIMLTNRLAGQKLEAGSRHWFAGILIASGVSFLLIRTFQQTRLVLEQSLNSDNQAWQVGYLLMSDYVAPFELSGLLLLICLIGAALAASAFKKST